jgi:glycerol uptake facilitator-like aquaporin
VGEFIGTFFLIYLGVGSNLAQPGNVLITALTWGMWVPVLVTIFGVISQALFNPAVSEFSQKIL